VTFKTVSNSYRIGLFVSLFRIINEMERPIVLSGLNEYDRTALRFANLVHLFQYRDD